MKRWIIDTHALLWFMRVDPRLPDEVRANLESEHAVRVVSVASVWEIAIKVGRGLLHAPPDLPQVLQSTGFVLLPVSPEHAWKVSGLPVEDHKDPFDRMLAAQALVEDLPVISNDAELDRYGVVRRW